MLVSSKWLRAHVDLEGISNEEIASKLTFAGVEVEGISYLAKGTNLVIGEIISCLPHPDSDHLHILQVDEGEKYGVHQIVCGAKNARKGLKVIVARSGAILPEVTIAPSKIRGIESDGMCCSLLELGVERKMLSEKQIEGIEELPSSAKVGEEDVLGYLGLDDAILDLSLLANRPDLYSLENVAKEVSALFERECHFDEIKPVEKSLPAFPVSSITPNCDRFLSILAKGLKIGESPSWMKELLRAEGIRSINNVVDTGNYVMLLTGVPLNMYDADLLSEQSLEVRDDIDTDWVAMDDKAYHLEKGDLCVCSNKNVMCLAGIMTSKQCAVSENTKNVVIEAAHFAGAPIRRTSNRLGLSSDSAQRFIKGTDIENLNRAIEMAAALLSELASVSSFSEIDEFRSKEKEEKSINVSFAYINERLGTSFDKDLIVKTLRKDHMNVIVDGDLMHISVPSYRLDITGKADISEEVIRLLGFDNVPSSLPFLETKTQGLTLPQQNKIAIRHLLRDLGLTEVLTYTLIKEKDVDSFSYLSRGNALKVKNPLTEDREYIRKSITPSLLDVASYNSAHQVKNLAIFEVSDVDTDSYKGLRLSAVMIGEKESQSLLKSEPYDFFDIKGVLVSILDLLGITDNRYEFKRLITDKEEFHPGRSAVLSVGRDIVAVFGELHPKALKEHNLKNAVALELDLGYLLSLKVGSVKAKVPSKYPTVSRDLALIVSKDVDFASIRKEIKRSDKLITDVKIFDDFEGLTIQKGKKSLGITIDLNALDKTLTDGEITAVMEKIIGILRVKFLAEVRQ